MLPSEDLLKQRDAVMFGKHVNTSPKAPDEACAIFRGEEVGLRVDSCDYLADAILRWYPLRWLAVAAVLDAALGVDSEDVCTGFNDGVELLPATREEILFLLDDAARYAKEAGE